MLRSGSPSNLNNLNSLGNHNNHTNHFNPNSICNPTTRNNLNEPCRINNTC